MSVRFGSFVVLQDIATVKELGNISAHILSQDKLASRMRTHELSNIQNQIV